MLFNSYEFLFIFLPLVMACFFVIAKHRHGLAALWLALASVAFYGYWDVRYVPLLLLSIGLNYGTGYAIAHRTATASRKAWLAAGILSNLALLAYFKYANFFIASIVAPLAHTDLAPLNIVLPLGISFFSFTQIAFLVDVQRGHVKEYRFVHYLLFVTYFPHLIAGPVLHHAQMMPQFAHRQTYRPQWPLIATGVAIFTLGLAKKVLLADNLAVYVAPVFDNAAHGIPPPFFMAWASALSYTLQLYFDFSGYSDMAIGLSLLFGITLPLNFNSPYQAGNIIEFWRRWHMTLSQFLRDYLYIPLGGNRHGPIRRHLNLMLTMLLGGLWHGANWTFVVWGGLHGLYLGINHAWQGLCRRWQYHPFERGIGRLVAVLITFIATVVAWVYFRADTLQAATLVLSGMFGNAGWGNLQLIRLRNLLLLGLLLVFLFPNTQTLVAKGCSLANTLTASRLRLGSIAGGAALGGLFASLVLMLASKSEFLYFQF